jgi:hypothetical protein
MASSGSGDRVGEKIFASGNADLMSSALEESPEDLNPWI